MNPAITTYARIPQSFADWGFSFCYSVVSYLFLRARSRVPCYLRRHAQGGPFLVFLSSEGYAKGIDHNLTKKARHKQGHFLHRTSGANYVQNLP